MKAFTYWETSPYADVIPPYVLCGIASMQMVMGDDFVLLTRANVEQHIDFNLDSKAFFFAALADKKRDSISRITARSDFIRFRYVQRNGGVWVDADTVVMRNFVPIIKNLTADGLLAWHSEQFFGARANNALVTTVADTMIASDRQVFANPGGCKELTKTRRDEVVMIPQSVWDPTGEAAYRSETWELSLDAQADLEAFYMNKASCLMKMYNSQILRTDASEQDVRTFLTSGSVIARMFLSVEASVDRWVAQTDAIREVVAG